MANIKIRNLNPGSYAQITSGSFLATALNENEGTQESSTVRATASQIVSGGAVYADFSEELMISGVPVSTGSTVGGKEVLKPGPGGSIEFGDTNTTINIEGPSIFKESVTINKTLDVTEAATFYSTSLFKGDSTFESNTTFGTGPSNTSIFNSTSVFNENSSFVKDVAIGGNLAVGGGLDIGGNLTAGGQKVLALDYSAANNGKVLKIVGGALTWATDDAGLSSVNISNVAGLQTALDGKAASSHTHSWSNITSGKPTTLAGYGITDAASAYTLTTASSSVLGGIKVGSNLAISSSGVLSAPTPTAAYSLPTATSSLLGGVKVGSNLSIATDGTLSAVTNTSEVQTIIQSSGGSSGAWQNGNGVILTGSDKHFGGSGVEWVQDIHGQFPGAVEVFILAHLGEAWLYYWDVYEPSWKIAGAVNDNQGGVKGCTIRCSPGTDNDIQYEDQDGVPDIAEGTIKFKAHMSPGDEVTADVLWIKVYKWR